MKSVRLLLGIFIALIIAGISSCATLVWQWDHNFSAFAVPLTSGLGGQEWAAISRAFDACIKGAFPIGFSVTSMGMELQHQGFSLRDWNQSVSVEREAIRQEDSFACKQSARVFWRANEEGRLTAIRGVYQEDGCL